MAYRTFLIAAAAAGLAGFSLAGVLAAPTPGQIAGAQFGHSPRPVYEVADVDLFHGYRCGSDNCLLHQQGYQWAADHRIGDARNCHGASEEFIEGCLAFTGIEGPLGERGFDASFPSVPN